MCICVSVCLSVCDCRLCGAAIGVMVVGATDVVTHSYVSRTASVRPAKTLNRSVSRPSHTVIILRCSQQLYLQLLTSLAVIPSVTPGRSRMQTAVISSPIRGKDSEADGHTGVAVFTLHCGKSALNCLFAAAYQLAMLCVCPVTKI